MHNLFLQPYSISCAVIFGIVSHTKQLPMFHYRLGDEGGQAIVKNMIKNKTLHTLNLASNDITETTAAVLSEVSYLLALATTTHCY